MDHDAERADISSKRLAVVNMDWDKAKANDLLVILQSFAPAGGKVQRVSIYPSEFGRERLRIEEQQGPGMFLADPEEDKNKETQGDKQTGGGSDDSFEDQSESDQSSDEEEEELKVEEQEEGKLTKKQMARVRRYQLERLKYYYAIVVCDSATTAEHIYKQCDGLELEASSARIDLRFVPDEQTFDESSVKDVANEEAVSKYVPRQFTTTALQMSKVQITWDENDPERDHALNAAFDKANKADTALDAQQHLRQFIASDSDSEPNESNEAETSSGTRTKSQNAIWKDILLKTKTGSRNKHNSESENSEHDGNGEVQSDKEAIEITWEFGDEQEDNTVQPLFGGDAVNESTKSNRKCKPVQSAVVEDTPWEQYLKKRTEKRSKRKAELKAKLRNGQANDSEETDDELIEEKKKKKVLKRASVQVDAEEDERAALQLLMEEDSQMDKMANKRHFSLKSLVKETEGKSAKLNGRRLTKQQKRKLDKLKSSKAEDGGGDDNFQLNLEDERFASVYDNADFHIDPSHKAFKKTKGTETIIEEKIMRKYRKGNTGQNQKMKMESGGGGSEKQEAAGSLETVGDSVMDPRMAAIKAKMKAFNHKKSLKKK